MYREQPDNEHDTGWRFFSGSESQEYADNPENVDYYKVNTIANYDRSIIPYLDYPIGTELERIKGTDKYEDVSDDGEKHL